MKEGTIRGVVLLSERKSRIDFGEIVACVAVSLMPLVFLIIALNSTEARKRQDRQSFLQPSHEELKSH